MAKYHQGHYRPKNPKKYMGDSTKIVYRSSWEAKAMRFFDNHPDITKWASEELVIPYVHPMDNRMHRYFPDFLIERINKDRVKQIILIEVKPLQQILGPKPQKGKNLTSKKKQRMLNEAINAEVISAKRKAAEAYCKKRGWTFMFMTEKDLFG